MAGRLMKAGIEPELRTVSLDIACRHMESGCMKMQSLPCYCATLRQAARAATVLYEEMIADYGLHTALVCVSPICRSPSRVTAMS